MQYATNKNPTLELLDKGNLFIKDRFFLKSEADGLQMPLTLHSYIRVLAVVWVVAQEMVCELTV